MKKFFKRLLIIMGTAAGFLVITAGIYIPFVVKDAKTDYVYEYNFDYLMILGNQVVGKDTPSDLMLERVNEAVEYLQFDDECMIVVCGGITTEEQTISEAALMKKILTEKGISSDRIIVEDKSTTTFENFEFAREVIETHSGKDISEVNVAFISSDYHIHRASIIADHFGFNDIGKLIAVSEEGLLKNVVREYFVGYDLLINIIKKSV